MSQYQCSKVLSSQQFSFCLSKVSIIPRLISFTWIIVQVRTSPSQKLASLSFFLASLVVNIFERWNVESGFVDVAKMGFLGVGWLFYWVGKVIRRGWAWGWDWLWVMNWAMMNEGSWKDACDQRRERERKVW